MFKYRLIFFFRNYFLNVYYGFGIGQIWLDDVCCNGYECDIVECELQGWGRYDCMYGNDIGVYCGRYFFFNLQRLYGFLFEKINEFFYIICCLGLYSLIVFNYKIFKLLNN